MTPFHALTLPFRPGYILQLAQAYARNALASARMAQVPMSIGSPCLGVCTHRDPICGCCDGAGADVRARSGGGGGGGTERGGRGGGGAAGAADAAQGRLPELRLRGPPCGAAVRVRTPGVSILGCPL
jgi:hypothetical protein